MAQGATAAETGIGMVKDINPGADGSHPGPWSFTTIGGTAYFEAYDPAHGGELWKTDGTEAGTVMVKDINPGPAYSGPTERTAFAGDLYFFADDGSHGDELWSTAASLTPPESSGPETTTGSGATTGSTQTSTAAPPAPRPPLRARSSPRSRRPPARCRRRSRVARPKANPSTQTRAAGKRRRLCIRMAALRLCRGQLRGDRRRDDFELHADERRCRAQDRGSGLDLGPGRARLGHLGRDGGPAVTPGTAVAAAKALVKGGKAAVALHCTGTGPCSGTLLIQVAATGKHPVNRRAFHANPLTIGRASFSVAAGGGTTVSVHLTGKGGTLLRKAGKKGLHVQLAGTGLAPRQLKLVG